MPPPPGFRKAPPGFRPAAQRAADDMLEEMLPEKDEPEVSGWESFGRGAAQGVTLGLQDEAAAGVEHLLHKITGSDKFQTYEKARDYYRKVNERAQKANPKTYFAGSVVGAAPLAAVAPTSLAATAGMGAVAGFGASEADTAGGLAKDTALGAGTGALLHGFTAARYGGRAATPAAAQKATKIGPKPPTKTPTPQVEAPAEVSTGSFRQMAPEEQIASIDNFGREVQGPGYLGAFEEGPPVPPNNKARPASSDMDADVNTGLSRAEPTKALPGSNRGGNTQPLGNVDPTARRPMPVPDAGILPVAQGRTFGDVLQNAGGSMKVRSLRPTPQLAEGMENIPGGRAGVGKEVLASDTSLMPSLTKNRTAKRIGRRKSEAGEAVEKVVSDAEAADPTPVSLDPIFGKLRARARELIDEPVDRPAGEKLDAIIDEYETKYAGKKVPLSEVYRLKKKIADHAYRTRESFDDKPPPMEASYLDELQGFERELDGVLDDRIGPSFEAANVRFRRIGSANQAAKKTASRQYGKNLIGLGGLAAGGVGAGGAAMLGTPQGLALGAAVLAANKYGFQLGARGAYEAGRALNAPAVQRGSRALVLDPELLKLFGVVDTNENP